MDTDREHLRLLAIFHYVVGALAAFFACIPLIHVAVGIIVLIAGKQGNGPPAAFGWLFILIGGFVFVLGWAFAATVVLSGFYISKRRHYLFCLVMAGVECVFMPFGTVLGVFSLIVLTRESVKPLFGQAPA